MKSSILALLLLQHAQAIPDYATGEGITAPTANTGATSFDCQGALRSGFAFVSKDWHNIYDTTANREGAVANNYFCTADDATNCSGAYTSGTLKTDFVKSSIFTDKQLALIACPQDEQVCAPKKTATIANAAAATQELTINGPKASDICSFLIEAT